MVNYHIVFVITIGAIHAEMMVQDLTYNFDNHTTLYWPGSGRFQLYLSGNEDPYYEANNFCTPEHGGTHMDAPSHFVRGKHRAHEVPLTKLISKNIFVVDVSDEASRNADLLVNKTHFKANENVNGNGKLNEGAMIFLYTGYSSFWSRPQKYFGGDPKNASAFHFPGLDVETAKWLANEIKISSIGIDTASIDYGQSETFKAHVELLSFNIPVFENVNLTDIISLKKRKDLTIIALPMKIKEGSGAPLRIIAT